MSNSSPTRVIDGKLVPEAGTWMFDPGHTIVGFEGRHLMVSRIRGTFQRFSGRLEVAEVPEASQAALVIEAASVTSGFKDRDDHLRSADWFDVDRYPTIRFQSKRIEHVSGGAWRGWGELTIRDVTRLIEVNIEFDGGTTDPWGNQKIGALIAGRVNREDFGLTWNMPLQTGGLVASKEITLTVAVEAIRETSGQLAPGAAHELDAAGVDVRP